MHPEFYCKDFKAIAPSSFKVLIGMATRKAAECISAAGYRVEGSSPAKGEVMTGILVLSRLQGYQSKVTRLKWWKHLSRSEMNNEKPVNMLPHRRRLLPLHSHGRKESVPHAARAPRHKVRAGHTVGYAHNSRQANCRVPIQLASVQYGEIHGR